MHPERRQANQSQKNTGYGQGFGAAEPSNLSSENSNRPGDYNIRDKGDATRQPVWITNTKQSKPQSEIKGTANPRAPHHHVFLVPQGDPTLAKCSPVRMPSRILVTGQITERPIDSDVGYCQSEECSYLSHALVHRRKL